MIQWTIALLISLGLLFSAEQWNDLSNTQKQELQSIIIVMDIQN
jgi:hypothetical protein